MSTSRSVFLSISLLLAVLSPAVAASLSSLDRAALQRAQSLMEQDRASDAIALLQPRLQQNRPHPNLYLFTCHALAQQHTHEQEQNEALACWQQGHDSHPHHAALLQGLSTALIQNAQFDQAIALIEQHLAQATAPEPQHNELRYLLAYSHVQREQYAAALTSLSPLPRNERIWPLMAHSQAALERWPELLATTEEWLIKVPESATAWRLMAQAQLALQQPQAATLALQISELLDPSNVAPLHGLYASLGAYDLASQCLSYQDNLQCLRFGLLAGRYQASIDAASRWTPNLQDWDAYHLLLGQLLQRTGERHLARQTWWQVGTQALPVESEGELRRLRQQRERARGQALLLIGQSHWLESQWPEAQIAYRQMARLPGYKQQGQSLLTAIEQYRLLD
ncbi:CDC27 family protein [Ferrimonas pelagia]